MTLNGWSELGLKESVEERRERVHRDLVARLRFCYPAEDPVEHLAGPASTRDISAWYALGKGR